MTALAGRRHRPSIARLSGPMAVMAVLGLVSLAVVLGASWQPLRVVAAAIAAWLALNGTLRASGRVRRARGWLAGGAVVWLLSELTRLGSFVGTEDLLLAEISLGGMLLCAAGTYVAAARGRLGGADALALYLDAAITALALIATTLVGGERFVVDAMGTSILMHAAVLVSIVVVTLLLNVTLLVPLRTTGNWELLAGLSLGAAGYIGLLLPGMPAIAQSALNATVAAGTLVAGHGAAHWTADEDRRPHYVRAANRLRRLLPLSSVALSTIAAVSLLARPEILGTPLRFAAGIAIALVALLAIARQTVILADRERVIERERRLADELVVAEAQYRSVVERVPGVVYVAEAGQHGRWHFVSPKIEELIGYTAEEWMADPTLWMQRLHPADRDRMIRAEFEETERTGELGRWEYRLIARDGRAVWVIDDEAVVARDAYGRPTMVQGILVDISDRKDLEDQLRHQALHDPLTGLPNRVLFVDRLAHALVRRHEEGGELAVLFADLDDFKSINDTLGHAAGDDLLVLVARRMPSVLRAEDTACRMGGDEFAFLLEGSNREHAEAAARRILDALAEPFSLGERAVTLSASIGIAFRPTAVDTAMSGAVADQILRDADTAMYAAKALGKGRVQTFRGGMDEPIARRRELHNTLRRAIDNGELYLEYQPIVDMRDRSIIGLEALVRWNHPQLGRLLPVEFVALAEASGLIDRLGEIVLRRAVAAMAEIPLLVSVNVSAHQLSAGHLPALVDEVLAATGMPPSRLMLELTESALAGSGAGAETELQAIRALGVRLALDDFGSGYSSLEYLGRLPVDVLKIDRSLIASAHTDEHRREVLRAIGHIATKLGLQTIVEGVELEAQRATLLDLGFQHAQGFLFAEPMPLAEALASRTTPRAHAS